MNIKIIDTNNTKAKELENRVIKAAIGINRDVNTLLICDREEARKLKLKSYPALIINDNLESEGRIVSTREIMKILKRYE
jgi:hypothetical protein